MRCKNKGAPNGATVNEAYKKIGLPLKRLSKESYWDIHRGRTNHEIRELLSDHATQLDAHYFRPTEDQVLREFMKAEQFLTIDPTMKMQQEIQTLRIEKSKMDLLAEKMAEYDKILGLS